MDDEAHLKRLANLKSYSTGETKRIELIGILGETVVIEGEFRVRVEDERDDKNKQNSNE